MQIITNLFSYFKIICFDIPIEEKFILNFLNLNSLIDDVLRDTPYRVLLLIK